MSESAPLSAQRALSAKWRARIAKQRQRQSGIVDAGLQQCADELDALPSIPDLRPLVGEMRRMATAAAMAGNTILADVFKLWADQVDAALSPPVADRMTNDK